MATTKKNFKVYSISVKPENVSTGNHSIAVNDWRLRTHRSVQFKMNNGQEYVVSYELMRGFIDYVYANKYNKKKHLRKVSKEVIDETTGDIKLVCTVVYLIPNEFIVTNGRLVK